MTKANTLDGSETMPDELDGAPQRRRRKKNDKEVDMDLNLTSMIDVIFQLLIYFILTITFIIDEGSLMSKLPGGGVSDAVDEGEKYVISLAPTDGLGATVNITFDRFGEFQTFEQLQNALTDAYNNNSIDKDKDSILIDPVSSVRWNNVVNAFNQCIAAGYTNVNFEQAR